MIRGVAVPSRPSVKVSGGVPCPGFNAPPAILKGYADRIFSLGFGYTPIFGGSEPRLTGRSLVSLTTSGAPDSWVRDTGVVEALRRIFDDHFAEVCGLSVLEHFHMGGVVPGVTPDAGEALLDRVRDLATRRFGPPSSPP